MPDRYSQSGNTLERFTGKERDTEENLNLDYFGARYYDTALGRWHSVDPKAKDFPAWSPYNYTLNNPLNMVDPDGQAPLDDIYFDSETGTTDIVRTDEPDQLFVDGKRAGGTDVSFWEEGAKTYNSYDNMFASTFGDRLLNDSYYSNLMSGASRPEIRKGLFDARRSVGVSRDFEVLGKSMALGAGVFSATASGVGIAMGGVELIGAGTAIGTAGNALNTGFEIKDGNIAKASLNASYMLISGGAGVGIKHATSSINFLNINNIGGKALQGNKVVVDQIIFSTIGASDNKK